MKRFTLLFLGILLSVNFLIAGGLVHNTNHSAAWTRMLVRDATTEIDGVFYNPAGLTKLGDGFHISLSNQSIFQTRTITSTYRYLNTSKYEASMTAPLFPSVYLAYKTGKFAFSFGVMPIGGGGEAKFTKGVPLMEVPIASLVPNFTDLHVTGYSVDMAMEGKSVFWGIQAGISYAISENVSVFAGARYVMAKNTYTGHIKDIKLKFADGNEARADAFMTELGTTAIEGSAVLSGYANAMTPLVSVMGGLTFDQAIAATVDNPAVQAQITGLRDGLIGLGTTNAGDLTLGQGQGAYYAYSAGYLEQGQMALAGAALMGDQEGDITQTGSGITPIIGANFSFLDDDLNFGLKYEFQTNMDLKNDVAAGKGFTIGMNPDGTPIEMFPNGATTNADIPAMFSIGMDYRIADPFKISLGYHTYFDNKTGWAKPEGKPSVIDNNFWELAVGFEYDVTESFLVSAGFLHAQTGVNKNYQSNLSYSLSSNTVGFGGAYKLNDTFKFNLGGYFVFYDSETYDYTEGTFEQSVSYKETYEKSTFGIGIGVDITLRSKK